MKSRVVSKERVASHGEVLTGQREVMAMLNLVEHETQRIESRFLEPACGDGNFLSEVLSRKLSVVEARYGKAQLEYERHAIVAVGSIYGIEILEDNVLECRVRLAGIFEAAYRRLFGAQAKPKCLDTVRHILGFNIIWGDALTLMTVSESQSQDRIIFSEWSPVGGSLIKRRDYCFREMLAQESYKEMPLFSDLGEEAFLPKPEKDYPPTHFLELAHD